MRFALGASAKIGRDDYKKAFPRDGPLFFLRESERKGELATSEKNFPAQQIMIKKRAREPLKKYRAGAFYYSMIFDGKSYCPPNKIMPNQTARKIFHGPEKCPDPPLNDNDQSLKEIPRDTCTSLARFALLSLS